MDKRNNSTYSLNRLRSPNRFKNTMSDTVHIFEKENFKWNMIRFVSNFPLENRPSTFSPPSGRRDKFDLESIFSLVSKENFRPNIALTFLV